MLTYAHVSAAPTIKTPARFFHHKEYGTRLLFTAGPINPRDQFGKNGITFHQPSLSKLHKTVKARVTILGNETAKETEQELYLNRGSLVKYIEANNSLLAIDDNTSDEALIEQLNIVLKHNKCEADTSLRHADTYHHSSLQQSFADSTKASFHAWLYQKTIGSLHRIRYRFIFERTEEAHFKIGELLAIKNFHTAYNEIPAYKEYIDQDKEFANKTNPTLADVTITSKNYIKDHLHAPWELHRHGVYPIGVTKSSTGSTGKPVNSFFCNKEIRTVGKSYDLAQKIEFGKRRLNFINAFALGSWATGMTATEYMRKAGSTFSVGPDKEKIIDQLEMLYAYHNAKIEKRVTKFHDKHPSLTMYLISALSKFLKEILSQLLNKNRIDLKASVLNFTNTYPMLRGHKKEILNIIKTLDKQQEQIVIAGYPPFLKDLVDYAKQKGLDFKKYSARGVVGGQAMSEALREKLIESGFSGINSSYGASDLNINIGVETDFEIGLRKELEKNPELAKDFYGHNMGVPMIFHCDLSNYFVETSYQPPQEKEISLIPEGKEENENKSALKKEDNKLIYTLTRNDGSYIPIRYELGDNGRVFTASTTEALLTKHGIFHLKPKINLPLLFVWGRDSAVNYRGGKVFFTDLERAITEIDKDNHFVKRAFHQYEIEGEERFDIWIELKEGTTLPTKREAEMILQQLLVNMNKTNPDLAYHFSLADNAALPRVRFFTKGKSPISDANGHRKQVLVFNKANLPEGYKHPDDKFTLEGVIDKNEDFINAMKNSKITLKL